MVDGFESILTQCRHIHVVDHDDHGGVVLPCVVHLAHGIRQARAGEQHEGCRAGGPAVAVSDSGKGALVQHLNDLDARVVDQSIEHRGLA